MKSLGKKILKFLGVFPLCVKYYDAFRLKQNAKILIQRIEELGEERNLFFIFPFYHTGGAEKVHLEIVKAVADRKPVVFFTLESANSHYKSEFEKVSNVFELYPFIKEGSAVKGKVLNALFNCINRRKSPTVFSCHSVFFYENIGRLNSEVRCIDLIHAFVHPGEPGAEYFSLPHVNRLNTRVFINEKTVKDLKEFYNRNSVSEDLLQRVCLIKNWVDVPATLPNKEDANFLKVLFVARNSPEKRVALIGRLGFEIHQRGIGKLTMVGDELKEGVLPEHRASIEFTGGLSSVETVSKHYSNAHVVVLLSTREGMPLTILEGMAHGCAILSTAVGGISYEVIDPDNGKLLDPKLEESELLRQAILYLESLKENALISTIAQRNYHKAKLELDHERFSKAYRKVLL